MGESLTEQRRVSDEGPLDCKALLYGKNMSSELGTDGTISESHG